MSSNSMSPETVFERIAEIVAAQIRVDQSTLTPQTNMAGDLAMDSIEKVELVLKVERAFHVSLDQGEAQQCQTLSDLAAATMRSAERSLDSVNV